MKKLLMFWILMILPFQAFADNFNYTGATAELTDSLGYLPGGHGAIGGPAADNRLGLAQQFTIDQALHMTYLNVDALVSPWQGTTTFDYKLYTQSTSFYLGETQPREIPLTSSLALTSQPLTFTTTLEEDHAGLTREFQMQIPFDYTFSPGTYWLAEEGSGYTYVSTSQTYIDPPLDKPMATPEPSTWALLGMGMVFAFIMSKRRQSVLS